MATGQSGKPGKLAQLRVEGGLRVVEGLARIRRQLTEGTIVKEKVFLRVHATRPLVQVSDRPFTDLL